jgi:hypothetical protein
MGNNRVWGEARKEKFSWARGRGWVDPYEINM